MSAAHLSLAPDLRRAIERLPKPDGVPEVQVTIEVSEVDPRVGPGSVKPKSRMVPTTVQFHRGVLTTPEGSLPVWVYEGTLALDRDASPADHAPARVAAWIREQLGPRCVAVDVSNVEAYGAVVRVAATVGGPERPD
ncbi:MAG: hypothetical protein Q8S73_10440 [Deltaproteobacteria bacterium]|nr:hypothetical protein [Myxococcales bacterium]MDP3214511.1 hypothetical protein [Deltaproteobacteria bacterium]